MVEQRQMELWPEVSPARRDSVADVAREWIAAEGPSSSRSVKSETVLLDTEKWVWAACLRGEMQIHRARRLPRKEGAEPQLPLSFPPHGA